MLKKILFNGKEFHFAKNNLPSLIHGEEHSGTSLFTITILADLCSQDVKIIALTGYSMAREEFEIQAGAGSGAFFTKERTSEFINDIENLQDLHNSVVLVKNIELVDKNVFNLVKNIPNVIFSGDVNKCSFRNELLQKEFKSKVYFSPLDVELPKLNKYEGFYVSEGLHGIVSVEV